MKRLTKGAFCISIFTVLPLLSLTGSSRLGRLITYNNNDTSLVVMPVKEPQKKADELDSIFTELSSLRKDVGSVNSKLDTGLQRQYNYIQSTNYLALKFVDMKNEITALNVKLKQKGVLDNQVVKQAEQGNLQKDIFKMLMIILFILLGIVGAMVAGGVLYFRSQSQKKEITLSK